ncbi:hypothetical protein Pint_35956 [Pistacia integerrima]|uniref:Uncharacterized protein n=1 Tax=Pistacia integerrima TaxID=434235 RepID=A0ACC0XYT8_9ROSI|nr:hypothetical protein Pint_35956 [Pistacia integerrima]
MPSSPSPMDSITSTFHHLLQPLRHPPLHLVPTSHLCLLTPFPLPHSPHLPFPHLPLLPLLPPLLPPSPLP